MIANSNDLEIRFKLFLNALFKVKLMVLNRIYSLRLNVISDFFVCIYFCSLNYNQ